MAANPFQQHHNNKIDFMLTILKKGLCSPQLAELF